MSKPQDLLLEYLLGFENIFLLKLVYYLENIFGNGIVFIFIYYICIIILVEIYVVLKWKTIVCENVLKYVICEIVWLFGVGKW